jgi:hypothetical protein
MADNDKMVTVPAALLPQMVSFIEKFGKFVEQAKQEKEQATKDQAQAKLAAVEAAELLVQKGLLSKDQQEKAAAAIGESHAKTVEILRRTASHVGVEKSAAAPAPVMGAPAGKPKSASMTKSAALAEADRRFEERLGL